MEFSDFALGWKTERDGKLEVESTVPALLPKG
jgi:hypothetical protein